MLKMRGQFAHVCLLQQQSYVPKRLFRPWIACASLEATIPKPPALSVHGCAANPDWFPHRGSAFRTGSCGAVSFTGSWVGAVASLASILYLRWSNRRAVSA